MLPGWSLSDLFGSHKRKDFSLISILRSINDLLVCVLDPAIYDAQPFLDWDSQELLSLVNFRNKVVIDVGAGTGRLTMTVAPFAANVFSVEPVANLRRYLKAKAEQQGWKNVFPVDGLITAMPFPDQFAEIVLAGHVFGDDPEQEYRELLRVARPGGIIILCPGNRDLENETHQFLTSVGFKWSCFEEPGAGRMRKYWKHLQD